MAKERMYGWNGEMPAKELSGQAKIVFDGLRSEPDVLRTGHAWTETIGPALATRQDRYRVVLYYIIILKGKGLVRTNEFDIDAVTKDDVGKKEITVKTEASLVQRGRIAAKSIESEFVEMLNELRAE